MGNKMKKTLTKSINLNNLSIMELTILLMNKKVIHKDKNETTPIFIDTHINIANDVILDEILKRTR